MPHQKDPNKLTSIDEYGSHLNIIPAEVQGYFRKHRSRIHFLLLIVFLLIPWIHINNNQLILLNISKREIIFLGLIFKSHDAPLIFPLLIIATLGLAFATAVWGRIWCGWACPQTVFIDAVYRKIETLTEGDYIERRRQQKGELTVPIFFKKCLKWLLFVFVSSLFAHSFAAYFIGSYELIAMMKGAPAENWNYFVVILFITAVITFDFGWFREQFCVIMCPYGRIQSVLLEPSSLSVVYDQERGEPRRGVSTDKKIHGDCVNCHRCVEVCPTGIDIRNGLQMECIACTACIDACDEIMRKINKPERLISYKTLDGSKFKILKFKTVAYGILIIIAASVFIYNLQSRDPVELAILRGIESPYTLDSDEQGQPQIINHYRFHFVSQSHQEANYELELSELDRKAGMALVLAQPILHLKPNGTETLHVFVKAPRSLALEHGQRKVFITVKSDSNFKTTREIIFIGPGQ